MKACVVDDDYTSLDLLGGFLEDRGWETVLFRDPDKPSLNGTMLEKELSNEDTKLLVMDVRFGRDAEGLRKGLTTVNRLAEEDTLTSNHNVVFVSLFGRDAIQFESVEATLGVKGIKPYWLDKPVDWVQLNEIINDIRLPSHSKLNV